MPNESNSSRIGITPLACWRDKCRGGKITIRHGDHFDIGADRTQLVATGQQITRIMTLEDVFRQIGILRQFAQLAAHIVGVDHNGFALVVFGIEAQFFQ